MADTRISLDLLSPRSHYLEGALEDLIIQREKDVVAYGKGRHPGTDYRKDQVRPLFATVRRQAAEWAKVLRDGWDGPVRIYVEFCRHVCQTACSEDGGVSEDRGFPTRDNLDFQQPEHLAWACLQAGAARARNQRPRWTGPLSADFLLHPGEVLDWAAFAEGLQNAKKPSQGESSPEDRMFVWLADVLPEDARGAIRRCAQEQGFDSKRQAADEGEVLEALNALINDPRVLTGSSPHARLRETPFFKQLGDIPPPQLLPKRERQRLARCLLESAVVHRESLVGRYPDRVIAQSPLEPFKSRWLIALPIYYRKSARLLGMVTLERGCGGRVKKPRGKAIDVLRRLVDGMIPLGLNTQLALLEATFRVSQTDVEDEVVEVAFHLARKYVGANDCCLRLQSDDKKVFSCKSDCQYHEHEFGTRKQRLIELRSESGTVGDNMKDKNREGEIVDHLLEDPRHVLAAEEAGIKIHRFLDNSALLVKTPIGRHTGIAALHHIDQKFYDTADFVLLKAILRTAEARLAELRRIQSEMFERSQEESNDYLTVQKQQMLDENRARLVDLLRGKGKKRSFDLIALCNTDLEVVAVYHGVDNGHTLLNNGPFREAARRETAGFGYPRSLWVHQGETTVYVDTSYDLSSEGTGKAVSEKPLGAPACKTAGVVITPIPGHEIGRLWLEKALPEGSARTPFSDEELIEIDGAVKQVTFLLETAWGKYVASEAGRSEMANISLHNLGHWFQAVERKLTALASPRLAETDRAGRVQDVQSLFDSIRGIVTKLVNASKEVSPSRMPVHSWVNHLKSTLASHAETKGVALGWTTDGLDGVVSVDLELIDAAVLEIFMNSVDALAGQPDKQFVVEVVTAPERVQCVLRDNGPGVPAEIRERVFDTHFTTKKQSSGHHGLGLFAARRYVRLNRGTLRAVEPPGGVGACFEIIFPNIRRR